MKYKVTFFYFYFLGHLGPCSGVTPGSTLRTYSWGACGWGAQGTIWDAGGPTLVTSMEGKCPTHSTIALAP